MKWSPLFGIVALVLSASCKEENKSNNAHNKKRGLELSLGLPGAASGVPGNIILPLAIQPQPQPQPQIMQYGAPQGQILLSGGQPLIPNQPQQIQLFLPFRTYAPQAQVYFAQLPAQQLPLLQQPHPQVLPFQGFPSAAYGSPRSLPVPQQLIANLLPPQSTPINIQQGFLPHQFNIQRSAPLSLSLSQAPVPTLQNTNNAPILQGPVSVSQAPVLRTLSLAQPSIQYGIPNNAQSQQGPLSFQIPQLNLQRSQEFQLQSFQQHNIPEPKPSLQYGLPNNAPLQQNPIILQTPQFTLQRAQEIPHQHNIPAPPPPLHGLPNNVPLQQGAVSFQSLNMQESQEIHGRNIPAPLPSGQLNLQRIQPLPQGTGFQRSQPLPAPSQPQINHGSKEQNSPKSNNGYQY